jgi:hypothetical protein
MDRWCLAGTTESNWQDSNKRSFLKPFKGSRYEPTTTHHPVRAKSSSRHDRASGGGRKQEPTTTESKHITATGSMNVPRWRHKTILLDNGLVLAVTGAFTNQNQTMTELYNPGSGKWTLTGSTAVLHEGGSVTLLSNGEVLLAGGGSYTASGSLVLTAEAELYNPSTGRWSTTGSMTSARQYQSAVLLSDGEVLMVGGEDASVNSIASAELYNPATGTWQETVSMHASRYLPVAELLGDGGVLVAGGDEVSNGIFTSLDSAEIYNPSTGEWTSTENFPLAPNFPPIGVGALLPNGDVLVVRDAFFNPGTATWTATGPFPNSSTTIGPSTATLLTTGEALLTGSDPPTTLRRPKTRRSCTERISIPLREELVGRRREVQ